ncbi:hypothetical protein GG344DRAFT_63546 [Lentinula edodes]|nr:hypothetical protein GG344DRAFT_63546 [Lentinula edodes]
MTMVRAASPDIWHKLEANHDRNVPVQKSLLCRACAYTHPIATLMIFRNIFLKLRTLSTAASIPRGRSIVYRKRDFGTQVSTKTKPSVRSLTSSEVHSVRKRNDEKWFKQLEASFNRTDLTSKLIERVSFSEKGSNNKGIFTLQTDYTVGSGENVRTYPKQTVIAKLINHRLEARAACEVWALNHFGLLIEAGRITAEAEDIFGVIVMHKQPGKSLHDVEEWNTAPVDQKRAVVQDLREQVHDLIYRWIQEKGVVHADFDPDNVLVDITRNKETNAIRLEHFAIVDFGSPGVWLRRKVPSEQTFTTWFNARWNFLWEEVIEKLGHAPDPKQEQKTQRRRLRKIDY